MHQLPESLAALGLLLLELCLGDPGGEGFGVGPLPLARLSPENDKRLIRFL